MAYSGSGAMISQDFSRSSVGRGHAVRQFDARNPLSADPTLLITCLLLLSFGLVMIYSTTGVVAQERFHDSLMFIKKQLAAAIIGVGLLVAGSYLSASSLRRVASFSYVIALVCALLPLVPGLGQAAGGAHRWLALGPIRFQPAEFSKLFFVLYLAGYFAGN